MSFFAAYLGVMALGATGLLKRYHDLNILLMFSLSALSLILAGACDVMLIVDAIKVRR
ncbi:MAG: hypothetical protein ACRD8A_12090 [Candidatus Acidiferrales bacterium]